MQRYALHDGQWGQIEDLFPENGRRGGQWKDHRLMVDGCLWILHNGGPWRDLPKRFGPWQTVYARFRQWSRDGTWDQILDRLKARKDEDGEIDWELFCIDGSVVRAHKAAAGARKNGPENEPADHALGRSRGGFTTKINLVCDRKGHPIAVEVLPGQAHESPRVIPLIDSIDESALDGGLARLEKLAGDKGCSSQENRDELHDRDIDPVLPRKSNENPREDEPFDREAYRDRNIIERCIGWLKELRRIATRYEKLAVHYLGMLKLGMICQYLKPT